MEALGESKAQTVLQRSTPWRGPVTGNARLMASCHFDMIGEEHPQVIAIDFAMLDDRTVADVLSIYQVELKSSVIRRLATLVDTISDLALQQLEKYVRNRFSESTLISSAQLGGSKSCSEDNG